MASILDVWIDSLLVKKTHSSGSQGETESEGIAKQEQALQTKYQATKIFTNRNK